MLTMWAPRGSMNVTSNRMMSSIAPLVRFATTRHRLQNEAINRSKCGPPVGQSRGLDDVISIDVQHSPVGSVRSRLVADADGGLQCQSQATSTSTTLPYPIPKP